MTKRPLHDLVLIHKALAHPVRLRILGMLRGGGLCVCQMNAILGLAASTVSQHLSELRRAGLVTEKKDGRWVEYRLADTPEVSEIVDSLANRLGDDPETRADLVLLEEVRRTPLDELCSNELDLTRLGRRAERAVTRANRIRAEPR